MVKTDLYLGKPRREDIFDKIFESNLIILIVNNLISTVCRNTIKFEA